MHFLRKLLRVLFWALVVLVFLGTLLPLLPSAHWFVRIWDYPRLQAFFLAIVAATIFYFFYYKRRKRGLFLLLLLLLVVVYHAYKAFPYTPLATKQVEDTTQQAEKFPRISLLVANVLQTNSSYTHLLQLVETYDPDLVITLESDAVWQRVLDKKLAEQYPFTVSIPQSNTYGMHLFSRLPLKNTRVMYLMEPDIPSIGSKVQLPGGQWIQLYSVHPRPPVPGESNDSRERDAELVMIGKMAKQVQTGVIVAGDFNDVAWSPTTRLFQEVSGLLDPRIGRGYYNTFHAAYPLFRWPLDHVFHSAHFKLVNMQRLPDIGSDHFPIFIQLSYEPDGKEKQQQQQVKPEKDTAQKAAETIDKGVKDKDAPGE